MWLWSACTAGMWDWTELWESVDCMDCVGTKFLDSVRGKRSRAVCPDWTWSSWTVWMSNGTEVWQQCESTWNSWTMWVGMGTDVWQHMPLVDCVSVKLNRNVAADGTRRLGEWEMEQMCDSTWYLQTMWMWKHVELVDYMSVKLNKFVRAHGTRRLCECETEQRCDSTCNS